MREYPPVTIIAPGMVAFEPSGLMCITGWAFDLHGRPLVHGEDPQKTYRAEIARAVSAYIVARVDRAVGAAPAEGTVPLDTELQAQRETEALIGRLKQ